MPYKPSVDELGPGQYLVTVVNGGDDLPEEVSGLPLAEASPLADVVVQLPLARVLHDDHNLVFVLKHCRGTAMDNHPVYLTSSRMTTQSAREDNRDVTEWRVEQTATGQDTSQAIQHHKELGKFSSQVDNDIITIVTGHTFVTLREHVSEDPAPLTRIILTSPSHQTSTPIEGMMGNNKHNHLLTIWYGPATQTPSYSHPEWVADLVPSFCSKPSRLSILLKIKPQVPSVAHQVLPDPMDASEPCYTSVLCVCSFCVLH